VSNEQTWIPEITYEEIDDGISSNIPFIAVPKNEEMPKVIFIFESKETGEHEPGPEGELLPIVEMDLHQYADMVHLKRGLAPEVYDTVRTCLGLKPLNVAIKEGQEVSDRIRKNVLENTKLK
tara:strand:- start:3253 stop:3618 length:366 start_codon:yes stop_codon:yes gene_type:complete